MKMKRYVLPFTIALLVAAMGYTQSNLQTVATVRLTRSEPITMGQLKTRVEQMERSAGRTLTTTERREVLDGMINELLVIQAAERDRITVSEVELNQQLQILRSNMAESIGRQPTEAEFTTAIREETGLDLPAFREQIRRQFLFQKYLTTKKPEVTQSPSPPAEAEILAFYNLNRASFVRPQTVRFSMIQIPMGESAADRTRARNLADQLIREIGSNPSRFDEAAVRGQASNAGYLGGDAGYLPRNAQAQQVVGPAFMEAAFNLRQGEVSRLIETPQGYHIIKITETYEMKPLELNDIFQLGTRMTVRDYIGNGLAMQRQQAVLTRATQELVDELRRGNPFQIFENNIRW